MRPLVLVFSWIALIIIVKGYVLSLLWGWFIVPVFNLPGLTMVPAIGVVIAISSLTEHYSTDSETKKKNVYEIILKEIVLDIIKLFYFLLFGWIVHLFM